MKQHKRKNRSTPALPAIAPTKHSPRVRDDVLSFRLDPGAKNAQRAGQPAPAVHKRRSSKKSSSGSEAAPLHAEIAVLKEELLAAKIVQRRHDAEKAVLEERAAHAASTARAHEATIAKMEAEARVACKAREAAQGEARTFRADATRLRAELAEAHAALPSPAPEELERHRELMADATARRARAEEEAGATAARLAQANVEAAAERNRELQDTQRELQDTQRELQDTQRELQDTQRELQDTQRELQDTQRELQDTQRELQGTQRELQDTQRELVALRDAATGKRDLEAEVARLARDELQLRGDLRSAEEERARARTDAESARKEVLDNAAREQTGLQSLLQTSQEELAEERERNAALQNRVSSLAATARSQIALAEMLELERNRAEKFWGAVSTLREASERDRALIVHLKAQLRRQQTA